MSELEQARLKALETVYETQRKRAKFEETCHKHNDRFIRGEITEEERRRLNRETFFHMFG